MKKKYKVMLMLLIVVGIGICIYFNLSTKVYKEYNVCSYEGDVKEIILDITIKKKLFKNDIITGKLIFEGKEYFSAREVYKNWSSSRNEFIIPTSRPIDINDEIYLNIYDEKKEILWIHVVNQNGQCSYFGPADNLEEVGKISEEIVKNEK